MQQFIKHQQLVEENFRRNFFICTGPGPLKGKIQTTGRGPNERFCLQRVTFFQTTLQLPNSKNQSLSKILTNFKIQKVNYYLNSNKFQILIKNANLKFQQIPNSNQKSNKFPHFNRSNFNPEIAH
jgi:hypothetical protein